MRPKQTPKARHDDLFRARLDQIVPAIAPDQKIEQNLALRRQKRPRPRDVLGQLLDIAGDQVLQEMGRLLAGDGDQASAGRKMDGHVGKSFRAVAFG